MTTRDEFYRFFGPKQIEALALVTLDEINVLRLKLGLSPRTESQLLEAVNNRVSTLPSYDWMKQPVKGR